VRVGYVRVSSVDQSTVRQLDGMAVERTFIDKASGKDTLRPRLDEMLAFVRVGDTVIVHSMDRLARNLDDLRRVVRGLTGRGVRVEFVKESLAFTGDDSPMATLPLSVMGAFAEFERAPILETPTRSHRHRQTARRLHRTQTRTHRRASMPTTPARRRWQTKSALATEFGISRETVYS
jgi:DNA invertase Pin-like site-specific DNA recombinase